MVSPATLLAAVLVAQPAEGVEPQGLYLKLSGIGVVQNDSNLRSLTGTPVDATLEYDTGYGVKVGVGHSWAWTPVSLSLELEYAYRTADVSGVRGLGTTTPAGGSTDSHGAMLNLVARIDVTERFGVYIGGGVGATLTSSDLQLDLGGPPVVFSGQEDVTFSWQAIGGVQYAFSENFVAYGGVTYFDAGDIEFESFIAENSSLGLVFGLRLYF